MQKVSFFPQEGTPLQDEFDLIIGGTALANELTLVTDNTKKFRHIKDLKIETGWKENNLVETRALKLLIAFCYNSGVRKTTSFILEVTQYLEEYLCLSNVPQNSRGLLRVQSNFLGTGNYSK